MPNFIAVRRTVSLFSTICSPSLMARSSTIPFKRKCLRSIALFVLLYAKKQSIMNRRNVMKEGERSFFSELYRYILLLIIFVVYCFSCMMTRNVLAIHFKSKIKLIFCVYSLSSFAFVCISMELRPLICAHPVSPGLQL